MIAFIVAPEAEDDLQHIWRYLLQEAGLATANRIQSELLDAFEGLAGFQAKVIFVVTCFTLRFVPSPQILDGLALHWPPLLLASLPSVAVPSRFPVKSTPAIGFRYFLVGLYWFTLVSLAQGKWPATTRVYQAIRRWLAVSCSIVFGVAFLGWVIGGSQHGPTGTLGVILGMAALIYALRVSRQRADETSKRSS